MKKTEPSSRALITFTAILSLLALILIALLVRGCNRGIFEVRGKVLRNGRPLEMPNCRITFLDDTRGVFRSAVLTTDGNYRVCNFKECGLPPGKYGAVISFPVDFLPPSKTRFEPLPPAELERRLNAAIPKRYRDPKTSGLELVITADDVVFDVNMLE